MTRGAKAKAGWTDEEIESCKQLMPFLQAARTGLVRSRWRPGDNVDDMLAPIVLAVLVEASKQIRPGELIAAGVDAADPRAPEAATGEDE